MWTFQKTNVPKLRANVFHGCLTAVKLSRSIHVGFSHADKFWKVFFFFFLNIYSQLGKEWKQERDWKDEEEEERENLSE